MEGTDSMRLTLMSVVLLLGVVMAAGEAFADATAPSSPEGEALRIEQTGREMLEGWYGADPTKLERILHPEFAKRGVVADKTGKMKLVLMDKERFIAATKEKYGLLPEEEWQIETEILFQAANTASVKVTSQYLVDVCQLAKLDGEWKVVNVLWYVRKKPPWA